MNESKETMYLATLVSASNLEMPAELTEVDIYILRTASLSQLWERVQSVAIEVQGDLEVDWEGLQQQLAHITKQEYETHLYLGDFMLFIGCYHQPPLMNDVIHAKAIMEAKEINGKEPAGDEP